VFSVYLHWIEKAARNSFMKTRANSNYAIHICT
jgi:hypothetical protein